MLAPVEPEPADILLDRFDILVLFLDRVGVVEAQVAAPAKLLRDPEIEAHGLGMSDMQVSVGLRWKAGDHGFRARRCEILADHVTYKILCRLVGFVRRVVHGCCSPDAG